MIWATLTGVLIGLVVGFMSGRLGLWARIHLIESRLRRMARDVRFFHDTGEEVPLDWVADELDRVIEEDLR